MSITPADLRAVPLFARVTDEHLASLLAIFREETHPAGATLFERGQPADRLLLLVTGEVVAESDEGPLVLRPVSPVGETSAIVGLRRSTTARTSQASTLLAAPRQALLELFERHGDVAYPVHHNLLAIIADKLDRDRLRMSEMRVHLIETQKAMKRMRDALLDAEDTPLHAMLFEELDAHIEQNRKGYYLVEANRAHPSRLRLEGGATRDVLRLSLDHLHVARAPDWQVSPGTELSGVLALGDAEIPMSGTVEALERDAVVVSLDLLIDEYAQVLEHHLDRLQLLDVVL